MNKYKMICIDIDGTLLNSEHKISPKTKEIIHIVSKKMKIPVILVSARMPKGILFLQEELKISNPIICYSGALIVEDKINILSNLTVSTSDVKQVFKLARDMEIHVSLYKDDEWYVEKIDKWVEQESVITNISPVIINYTDLFALWEKEKSGPNKILCMAESNQIEALNAKINDYKLGNLNIYLSKPEYLEMMPNNASKTSAIEILCKKYNIESTEVIAIGDNYNDINMIEYAGMGIAMGNAPEAVKQYAKDVTFTNDEDGVAEAIKKYVVI